MGKLWLICEDRGNRFSKLLSQIFIIFLVCYLNETLYGLFIKGIQIGFVIEPRIIAGYLKISKLFLKSLFQLLVLTDLLILCQITVLQAHLISSQKGPLIASDSLPG